MLHNYANDIERLIQGFMSLKGLRKGPALTVISERLGVSTDTLYKWSGGKATPKQPQTIEAIAEFGVTECGLKRDWVEDMLAACGYAADKETLLLRLLPPPVPFVPNNLPHRPPPLIGRGRELQEIRSSLALDSKKWGVLIQGPPGVGKTAVALQAAWDAVDRNATLPVGERFDYVVWTELQREEPRTTIATNLNTHSGGTFSIFSELRALTATFLQPAPQHKHISAPRTDGLASNEHADAPDTQDLVLLHQDDSQGNSQGDYPNSLNGLPGDRVDLSPEALYALKEQHRILLVVDGLDAQYEPSDGSEAERDVRLRDILRLVSDKSRILITSRSYAPLPRTIHLQPLPDSDMSDIIVRESQAQEYPLSDDATRALVHVSQGMPLLALVALDVAAKLGKRPVEVIQDAQTTLGPEFWNYLYGQTLAQLRVAQDLPAFVLLALLGLYAAAPGATVEMLQDDVNEVLGWPGCVAPRAFLHPRFCEETLERLKHLQLVISLPTSDETIQRYALAPLTYSLVRHERIETITDFLNASDFTMERLRSAWRTQMVHRVRHAALQQERGDGTLFATELPNFLAASEVFANNPLTASCLHALDNFWLGALALSKAEEAQEENDGEHNDDGDIPNSEVPPLGYLGAYLKERSRDTTDVESLIDMDWHLRLCQRAVNSNRQDHHWQTRSWAYDLARAVVYAALSGQDRPSDARRAEHWLKRAQEGKGSMGTAFLRLLDSREAVAAKQCDNW